MNQTVQQHYPISLGKDSMGNDVIYKFRPYESKHIMELGITRSGKSNLVDVTIGEFTKLPESVKPNIIVIDNEQEFGRLRKHNPDFIILGEDGELPLILSQARELGKLSRTQRLNLVIRITSFFEKDDRHEFIKEFIQGMLDAGQEYWLPTLFVCDEIQIYASGKQSTPAKNAITTLAETGLKRGILCLIATQGFKEVYSDLRKQCSNGVMGYTKDKEDCEMICTELLSFPKTDWEKIKNLVNAPGSFYATGPDISDTSILFRARDLGYRTLDEKFRIFPTISKKGLQQVEKLRASLMIVKVDADTLLRQEIARLEIENKRLSGNQMTYDNLKPLLLEERLRAWDQYNIEVKNTLIHEVEEAKRNRGFLGSKKPLIVIFERMEDGRVKPVKFDKP